MTGPGQGSWQPDPEGRFDYRWHDGQQWTDQVSQQGQVQRSPLGGPPAPQAQTQQAQPLGGADGFSGISGDLVDGRFSEKEAKPIANQNAKLLRVRLGEPFMARQGSMVAYQGNVDFAYEGSGASKFIKKALTGEGLPLMRCSGQGDVFLAERAFDVHLLNLDNSGLSISGKNVLAFSSSLDWNVERVRGGSMVAGGLFNTTLRGTGWVALTTDGAPVVLNAAEAPTFADTNAIVAWSANLQTQLKTSFKAGALIGRGSGEAMQVSFYGNGFVIVQPSEGIPVTPTA
ncbi:AIM24 family protein [Mycobacterium sp. pW049]|uniref:AIM24 family protein n=1 Tax=[Mycobacterium] bulgaricum TaxID=3238985 RepID=UPI00351BACF1